MGLHQVEDEKTKEHQKVTIDNESTEKATLSQYQTGSKTKNLADECKPVTVSSNFDLDVEFGDDDFIFENYGKLFYICK